MMVGQAEQDISSQQTQYEICVNMDVISALEAMLAVSVREGGRERGGRGCHLDFISALMLPEHTKSLFHI